MADYFKDPVYLPIFEQLGVYFYYLFYATNYIVKCFIATLIIFNWGLTIRRRGLLWAIIHHSYIGSVNGLKEAVA